MRASSRATLAERAQAPAELPELPDPLAWRSLVPADVDALTALIGHIEATDNPPYRTTTDEVRDYFDPGQDYAGIGGFDGEGKLRAFGFVRLRHGEAQVRRVFLSGGIEASLRDRGVGRAILDWQLARARQILASSEYAQESDVTALIVVDVDDDTGALAHLLASRGFAPRRYYSQLRRDLTVPIPELTVDRPLYVEPWTPSIDDAVRRAHNTAFNDVWGSEPLTPQEWQRERSHNVPSWSFVALDRSSDRAQVAGYLMSGRYEHDWPALGWTEGYTEILGVLPAWRGRHVAGALLTHAMRAYAADGMQYAGLDVDADNPTGAIGVFGRLDYEQVRSSAVYMLEI
ncbi:GNAT family N-acetyltransferase [Georgenia halophila]|uniref:GNAT family N-acetyltransferase n=1 Tax=Georgenia halophila TaxID=620889 RepID=A0ABP8LRP7_9MICO